MSHSGFANYGAGREKQREISEVTSPQSLTWQTWGEIPETPAARGDKGQWGARETGWLNGGQHLHSGWSGQTLPGQQKSTSGPHHLRTRLHCAGGSGTRGSVLPGSQGPRASRGATDSPPPPSGPWPARPAQPAQRGPGRYALKGNARPFCSRSLIVSSPLRLVSSMKGGEQILSSVDREEAHVSRPPASPQVHFPVTHPPPRGLPRHPCSPERTPQLREGASVRTDTDSNSGVVFNYILY